MARLRWWRKVKVDAKVEQGIPFEPPPVLGPMRNVQGTSLSSTSLRLADELPAEAVPLRGILRHRDDPTGKLGGPFQAEDATTSRSRDFLSLQADTLYTLTTTPIGSDGVPGPATSVQVRTAVAPVVESGTRSMLQQPFAASSIWNTPIGSNAVTKHAGLAATPHPQQIYKDAEGQSFKVVIDPIYIGMNTADPQKLLSNISEAGLRAATPNYIIPANTYVHVPSTMAHNGSWNGVAAFVRPGGKTYTEGQSLYLSAGGDPRWCYTIPKSVDVPLDGDGRLGMHGGSGISGLGGVVRRKEWDEYATKPLQHVLSMNLFGKRFLSRGTGPEGGPGWTWPATKADSGFNVSTNSNYYALTDPSMPMMGSLLRLPMNADLSWVTHPRVMWLAKALQGFGAYVVDNTAWDAHAFSMEKSVQSLFGNETSTFHSEIMRVVTMLHIVTNNRSFSVGGGGTPVVAPPPPLATS